MGYKDHYQSPLRHDKMKVVLLCLAALAAAVSAEVEPWCRCAAMIMYDHSNIEVYEAPEVTIASCQDDVNECKNKCKAELDDLTGGGDLWMVTDSGETVGQYICSYLAGRFVFFLSDHHVYGYYEVCGGAWQYADVETKQELCCGGGQQKHCTSRLH